MNEKTIGFGDRMYGLFATGFFGGFAVVAISNANIDNIEKIIGGVVGAVGSAEGLGDLISGRHHYLSSKVINYFNERRNVKYLL